MELNYTLVQRNLRLAVQEWYAWLSDKARYDDEWRGVPSWCKHIPSRLYIPWAIHDLKRNVGNRGMIRALFIVVDEVYMSSQQMDGAPSVDRLRNELLRWYEGEYE